MALSSTMVWEIRSTATAGNVNGGGYNPAAVGGSDYSQQDAAQYTLSGLTSSAANAVILTSSASADMIGNIINITAGTNATTGWYEILSVSVGVSITVDRTWCTAAVTSGTGNIGGALSLGATNDNTALSAAVPGNSVWVKAGTYNLGQAVSTTAAGTAALPMYFQGYQTTRGDKPSFANAPTINNGAFAPFVFGTAWTRTSYLNFIGTDSSSSIFTSGGTGGNVVAYCKFVNNGTSASGRAITFGGAMMHDCEIIAYRGTGMVSVGQGGLIYNCYFHDCNIGYQVNATGGILLNCIVADCVTSCWDNASGSIATAAPIWVVGNTFYGANNVGIGINNGAGGGCVAAFNNIFYGLATGFKNGNAATVGNISDFNCYFSNSANYLNQAAGANDITTTDPQFANVSVLSGTGATTSAGILTDASANFTNVVNNQDFCTVLSATGVTLGKYLITSHTTTTLTLSPAPASGSAITYTITLGHNFAVGANLKNLGMPQNYPGALTQSYPEMGAAQRFEAGYSRGRVVNL